jgi:hypothetical protein
VDGCVVVLVVDGCVVVLVVDGCVVVLVGILSSSCHVMVEAKVRQKPASLAHDVANNRQIWKVENGPDKHDRNFS